MGMKRTQNGNNVVQSEYDPALAETKSEISATTANIYGFELQNNHSAEVFVQFFNKAATDVTVGTTAPDYVVRLPSSSNYGVAPSEYPLFHYAKGITWACTSTRTGLGAPGAVCSATVWYWNQGN